MTSREHWDGVYARRDPAEASWFQAEPTASLRLIGSAGLAKSAPLVDVGGGASRLVDCLLECGYSDLTVLDISARALEHAHLRLGSRAAAVRWRVADVTGFEPDRRYALWHDRAVFHFLTEVEDRAAYARRMHDALAPGGQAIIATFGPAGPERCSGLPVVRYTASELTLALGGDLRLIESLIEQHRTPAGAEQQFIYCRFVKEPGDAQPDRMTGSPRA